MKSFYRQPLFHFLLVGLLIFIAYAITKQPENTEMDDGNQIVVSRDDLLNFMQFRAQAFQPELFREQLAGMSESEINVLLNEYVREEVLYREAVAMGMENGDYIIRQRLVQKVEFLLENLANQALEPTEEALEAFYLERQNEYSVDAVYTFTHIFFDGGERGWEQARADAEILLNDPQLESVSFNDASGYGDRYPFLQNYVERTRDFVINNFTEEFVAALDTVKAGTGKWHGPLESRYGVHLVLLREKSDPYIPAFDAIAGRVMDDWRYETVLETRREAENRVVEGYNVVVDLDPDE